MVIGFDGDSGKGSGRSVSGIDLGAAIHKLAREGLITAGGGHKMAAGLSLTRAQLGPAMERLGQLLEAQGAGALGPADLKIDGTLMPGGATVELIEQLEQAGPFGAGASAPTICFSRLHHRLCKAGGRVTPKNYPERWIRNKIRCNLLWRI